MQLNLCFAYGEDAGPSEGKTEGVKDINDASDYVRTCRR